MTEPLNLRPYQRERADLAFERIERIAAGDPLPHPAIVMATGVGKTRCALAMCDQVLSAPFARAGSVLWLVDIKTLIKQTEAAGVRHGVAVNCRTIQGLRYTGDQPPVRPGDYDLIVVDEAHKFLTERRLEILRAARTPILGLTATPRRGDGRHIRELFGDEYIGGAYTIGAAITDSYLADCAVKRVELRELDLSSVKRTATDFDRAELSEAMNTGSHNAEIVKRWVELGRDRITNFFCVDTKHADDLAAEVNRQCGEGTCVAIHSHIADAEARIEAFRRNEVRVVASVMMIAEGFDHPPLSCGVLARPTRSERLLVQMLGRLLRLHASKAYALLLDCAGSYEGLDLASVYDVVAVPDEPEATLTEAACLPEIEDDGIPMLSEVISRVHDLDLFRRQVRAAQVRRWMPCAKGFALVTHTGALVVGPSRYDPQSCAIAWLYRTGHTCVFQTVAKALPEAVAFGQAEAVADRWGLSEIDDAKATREYVDRWFRDKAPPSDKTRRKLAHHGVPCPPQHGQAVHEMRRLYAMGVAS